MEKFVISDEYRNDDDVRENFFEFAARIYPRFDFREWYRRGFWRNNYRPISIVVDGIIIANVSITKMKVLIEGKPKNAIQIGTVGTIPEFRNQGLSRILMEYIMEKYADDAELIFLFANDSVLKFYPRFGFKDIGEVVYISKTGLPRSSGSCRKLDYRISSDFTIIDKLLKKRKPLTSIFGALEYDYITWWHILNIFSGNLYYRDDEDILFIMSREGAVMHIWDIVYNEPFEISAILPKVLGAEKAEAIVYHFPPDLIKFQYDMVESDTDSGLFVLGNFPIKGRQFKFPVTAQT